MDSYVYKSILRCFRDNDSIYINYFIDIDKELSPFEFLVDNSRLYWGYNMFHNEGRKYALNKNSILVLK